MARSMDERDLTWTRWPEALPVIRHHFWRTLRIALVVGTVLFCINQLDVVWSGRADLRTWLKVAVTYCVPFAVSNVGVLVGSRRPPAD
jgi:hypothetical protein